MAFDDGLVIGFHAQSKAQCAYADDGWSLVQKIYMQISDPFVKAHTKIHSKWEKYNVECHHDDL